ncbi:MAG: AzlC family ABC transporter permease [Burkholderiales bacterium]|nr:AzlC family ABC transporter permease [Burkholderiales bacterium]
MFFLPSLRQHPSFRDGVREMLPLVPGTMAWGLMTGVAMVKSGMSVFEAIAMTLIVFAGSAQLASVPLIMAGAPVPVILAAAFCVNLRFVVFSLHLRPYFAHLPRWLRVAHGYFTGDATYVLFTQKFPHPSVDTAGQRAQEAYLAGNCLVQWFGWMVPSLIGVIAANAIPTHWGLGFAGILCLIGIMSSLASTRLRVLAAAVAAVVSVAAYAVPLKLNIVLAIGAAVLLMLGAERVARPGEAARP